MLVQKLRLQRGWSQQQLADLSGLSVRTIQRIEQGQGASVESLKSLAAVFEIPFHALQEPAMPPSEPQPTPSTEAIAAAANAPASHLSSEETLALLAVRRLRGFYTHLLRYLLVVGVLAALNLWRHPERLWFPWVALFWGIGLAVHGLRAHGRGLFGPAWEKAQIEKRLGRKL